jgi:hypothetical protein
LIEESVTWFDYDAWFAGQKYVLIMFSNSAEPPGGASADRRPAPSPAREKVARSAG